MVEDVGSFIETYSGVVGSNKTKIEKLVQDYKKKIADGNLMNEPAAL